MSSTMKDIVSKTIGEFYMNIKLLKCNFLDKLHFKDCTLIINII